MQNIELADEIIGILEAASGNSVNYERSFVVADWISSDGGDTYQLVINHGLNTTRPIIMAYDNSSPDQKIEFHRVSIFDANTVILKVTQAGNDARFDGKVVIDV